MDIGHITQLVKGELGPHARSIYHQDLPVPQPIGGGAPTHLKTDTLGAGDFIFVDSGVAGSQPSHNYSADGLLLSVVRPIGASVNLGEWAAVNSARRRAVCAENPRWTKAPKYRRSATR